MPLDRSRLRQFSIRPSLARFISIELNMSLVSNGREIISSMIGDMKNFDTFSSSANMD